MPSHTSDPKPSHTSDPKYLTLGPGTLTFGDTGSALEIADYVKSQVTAPIPTRWPSPLIRHLRRVA